MSMPIQIWTPLLWGNPNDATFSRDFQRAQREWKGEQYVWLDPDVHEVKRWVQQEPDAFPERACLIPSESINGFFLIHLDEGRKAHPFLPPPDAWNNTLPEGLYRQWLHTLPDFIEGHTSLSLLWPVVTNTQVSYEERELILAPGSIMPITGTEEQDRTMTLAWPPPGVRAPSIISIEMESEQFHGRLERRTIVPDGKAMSVVVSEKHPESRAFNVWLQWSKPFDLFFPQGAGGGSPPASRNHAELHSQSRSGATRGRQESGRDVGQSPDRRGGDNARTCLVLAKNVDGL